MLLAFDTETTGLPDLNKPFADLSQPHIVQLAAILRHPKQAVEPQKIINYIVKPDGWTISPEMTAIHGISQEQAMDVGVAVNDMLDDLLSMAIKAHTVLGHNLQFDMRLVRIQECRRYGEKPAEQLPISGLFHSLPSICTQTKMTPIMNLPPTAKMVAAGRNHPKSPKLTEAFAHCYPGMSLGNAHNALTDVKMTLGVHFWLCKQSAETAPQPKAATA